MMTPKLSVISNKEALISFHLWGTNNWQAGGRGCRLSAGGQDPNKENQKQNKKVNFSFYAHSDIATARPHALSVVVFVLLMKPPAAKH